MADGIVRNCTGSQIWGLTRHGVVKKVAATVLALCALGVGLWASIAPRSFFTSFPAPGHHWVDGLGPYNEHLVRDVGGFYLALALLSLWTLVRAGLTAPCGAAWIVFGAPHLAFHLRHLDALSTVDKLGYVAALSILLLLAIVLVLPTRGRKSAACVSP